MRIDKSEIHAGVFLTSANVEATAVAMPAMDRLERAQARWNARQEAAAEALAAAERRRRVEPSALIDEVKARQAVLAEKIVALRASLRR